MIAHVSRNGATYEVKLSDPDLGEVSETLSLSEEEYQTWQEQNSDVTIELYLDESVSLNQNQVTPSPSQSSDSPPVPQNKEDQEQVDQYRTELHQAKRLYAGITPSPPVSIVEPPDVGNDDNIVPEDQDDGEPPSPSFKLSSRQDTANRDQETTDDTNASLDKTSLSEEEKELSQTAENSGLLNSSLLEPVPEFKDCEGDFIYSGKNNQWIVLGRDRPGGYKSGYGPGEGDTQAGAIDIVVGRMSPHPRVRNRDGSKVRVSPIFNYALHEGNQVCDASRIYISQKTDIDSNFKLANGRVGNAVARAGIAIKSDSVRIIARDSGIKLVTQSRQLMNSQGGKSSRAPSGIDIIAGNDDANLQPMVLGNNLVEVLREYGETINQVVGTITSIIENIAKLDVALATHFHPQAFPAGVPNIPSPSLAPVAVESITKLISLDTFSAYAEKFKLEKIEKQYLSAGALQSIRSSFNNVN